MTTVCVKRNYNPEYINPCIRDWVLYFSLHESTRVFICLPAFNFHWQIRISPILSKNSSFFVIVFLVLFFLVFFSHLAVYIRIYISISDVTGHTLMLVSYCQKTNHVSIILRNKDLRLLSLCLCYPLQLVAFAKGPICRPMPANRYSQRPVAVLVPSAEQSNGICYNLWMLFSNRVWRTYHRTIVTSSLNPFG